MLKSNPDLTTIGNIVVSVAALATMTALLITKSIDLTVAGYFLAFVASLNGVTLALKATPPQLADQLITALAASGPINPGPLVQIHTTPAVETQVSGAALPGSPRLPQPIILPGVSNSVPPGQSTLTVMPPQGTAIPTGTWQTAIPPTDPQSPTPLIFPSNSATATSWTDQPTQQTPFKVDRNWTGLVPTVAPNQPPQQ